MFDIERYLNVRSAHGVSVGPDGDHLSFLMDTTGVPQVWTLDSPGGWPEQRTFFDDRVTFASWSPERLELIVGRDRGGDEKETLYLLSVSDGSITDLTEHPDAKHWFGGWSPDGERFAFASNRRDQSVFDVYVQDRDATGSDAERVYEGDGWFSVAGWSPDGDRLLLTESHSSFDQDVYVLDVETGSRRHLTPHEGTVRHLSANWGPAGENVYLVTDRDTDTLRLSRIDLATDELSPVEAAGDDTLADDEWNVDGVAVDQDSRRLVYSRNADGYTELGVGELVAPGRLDHFPTPDLPDAVAGGVSFGPDGDRFALTVTRSDDTANVYVVDVTSGEATRWTRASTAGIPRDSFVAPELVRYPSFDGLEIPAFFSLPETDTGHGETPVVVDVHGGPESQRRPSFGRVKQYLLSRGYAVFEPNVRGSTGYGKAYTHLDDVEKRMDSVADLKAGVDWLHDHPAVDPDRIAVMGASYGGFMTLAALTAYPDIWAAGVDIVGIANFVTFLENTGDWRRELREAEYGSLAEDREMLESISPINHVEDIAAPLFVLHGENDPRVPVSEAHRIVEGAREAGVPVRELVFEDEGHGFTKLENRIEAYSAIVEFLDTHLAE
ncbi:S9 family peptidase [Haloplanus aerogenes]|uniref:Dipeptidyl aminopeptidase/acylaminoacyl peptidase n=1 Tax=Haloplanus aerogenes TaxID=660522 RepID=A0A3M0D3D4_9EURY|nr:S9 family peptidase [Haloplanus aerogenes]AZH25033.1 S9 family peptidase [Haloplanus aerogenes]RMB13749.1 dipeptidyl aminopeptidase/acylaminoacyl peptidase [Haloplanus aerogenes]